MRIKPSLNCRWQSAQKISKQIFQTFQEKNQGSKRSIVTILQALFQGQRRNIEGLQESVRNSDYNGLQHFISEAAWHHRSVMDQFSQVVNTSLQTEKRLSVSLFMKAAKTKKATNQFFVTRQFCGITGKTDNCQVAVDGTYSTGKYYGLADYSLCLFSMCW